MTNARTGMDPGTWTVATGPRRMEHERCRPGARRPCPDGRGWCDRWHQIWEPMGGITVDHIVEMVPDGGLVRLDTGSKQGTVLTTPQYRDQWLGEHPVVAAGIPAQRHRSDQAGINHADYRAASLRDRINREQAPAARPTCHTCGQPLFLIRPGRVQCDRCRVAELRGA